jgi:hypothetical protein
VSTGRIRREITRHHDPDPDQDPWVHGPPSPATVAVAAYDPSRPGRFCDAQQADQYRWFETDVEDRIRRAATTIYQALIEAEVTAVIGAGPHERTKIGI